MVGVSLEGRRWLGRVRAGTDGVVCGAAFAVDDRHLLTCAHVVQNAGAVGPGDTVFVDFPWLGRAGSVAVVLEDGWAPENGTSGDTALLLLEDPPAGLEGVPLRSVPTLADHQFACYGFPAGYEASIPAEGTVGLAAGLEWVTLKVSSGVLVEQGFSGAAIWSKQLGAVAALLVTRDASSEGRVGFAVPVREIARRSRVIADALPTALDLDPDRETHWGPRSRGVSRDNNAAGWLFTGRRQALRELAGWVATGQPKMRVVTGVPGCGKSAVLARLVTTADRHYRRRIPDLDAADETVPSEGAVDVTLRASGMTVTDVVNRVASLAELTVDGPAELVAALARRARRLVIVVDALDEALEPREVCWLLADLARDADAQVLIGCREHLLSELPDPDPMRLDQLPYLSKAEVTAYVTALLTSAQSALEATDLPGLAGEVADAAAGNFLIAQLTARAVLAGGTVSRPFPRTVRQALDRLLDALPESAAVRDLLLPLAYASGDGLSARDGLWLAATAALRRPFNRGDLDDLLYSPAGSFLTARLHGPGGPVYRLFHQSLADTLIVGRDAAHDQQRIWAAWNKLVHREGHLQGQLRSWASAPTYLLQHGGAHAAAAGRLGQLLGDIDYLLHADLTRLVPLLPARPSRSEANMVAVLRLTSALAAPLPPAERAQLFALGAARLGLPDLQHDLVSHVSNGWVLLWAHSVGAPHQRLYGDGDCMYAVAVGRGAGGEVIVSGGSDGTVRVWDADDLRPVGDPLAGHAGNVLTLTVGAIGGREVIVSGGEDGMIRMWDAATLRPVGAPLAAHSDSVRAVAVGRVGDREVIVSGSNDGMIRMWDAATLRPVGAPLAAHGGPVFAVALGTANGRKVIVSGHGNWGTVRVWDAATGDHVRDLPTQELVLALAVGRAGGRELIVSGSSDGMIRMWDAATGQPVGDPLTGYSGVVLALAVGMAGDRDVIVAGDWDGMVRVWDAVTGQPVGEPLTGHSGWVNAVAVGRKAIVSAGTDGTVRVWDAASRIGDPLAGHTGPVSTVAVCTGGRELIVSSGGDGTIQVWDAATGQPAGDPLTRHKGESYVVAVGMIGGREVIVSGGRDGLVRLWDAVTGQPVGDPVSGHSGWVQAVAVGAIGGREVIVSGGGDGLVRLWDAVTGQPVGDPLMVHDEPTRGVAVGRAGDRDVIVAGDWDGLVRVWDATAGQPAGDPMIVHIGPSSGVALGRVGGHDVIMSGGHDGIVRLWDAVTGQPVGDPLTGHSGWVNAVAVGQVRDRDVIISGGHDGTVRIRDATGKVDVLHLLDEVRDLAVSTTRLVVAAGTAVVSFSLPISKLSRADDAHTNAAPLSALTGCRVSAIL